MNEDIDDNDFEDEDLSLTESLFSIPVIINGNKTEVTFNCCGKNTPGVYYAVNLVRNGSCVNSYTMARLREIGKTPVWKFEEEYVPRELKAREQEFSNEINRLQ